MVLVFLNINSFKGKNIFLSMSDLSEELKKREDNNFLENNEVSFEKASHYHPKDIDNYLQAKAKKVRNYLLNSFLFY